MVELDVKIEPQDLYDYMLMHTYNSASGILGSTVGAVVALVGIARGQVLFIVAGLVLLLYLPWTLFLKSRQQALRNPAFKAPLHYVLDESGITVSQNGEEQHQDWGDMVKALSTGHSIIVYTSRVNATIFPKREMGDKKTDVIEMISTHMPPQKVKIRN
ncbi:MAG: YcxB family protein [Lachnospiraceae bacterium]|nr:YcxB family protein [Lachnospiraceae bacterium]